jgi:hypothetical protein
MELLHFLNLTNSDLWNTKKNETVENLTGKVSRELLKFMLFEKNVIISDISVKLFHTEAAFSFLSVYFCITVLAWSCENGWTKGI